MNETISAQCVGRDAGFEGDKETDINFRECFGRFDLIWLLMGDH